MKVVCDASIVLDAFLAEDGTPQIGHAVALVQVISRGEVAAFVPLFFKVECAHGLAKFQWRHADQIKVKDVLQTLALIDQMPLQTFQQSLTGYQVGGWAFAMSCGAYDAVYIELARLLDAPVATTDRGMAAACKRFGVALWAPY